MFSKSVAVLVVVVLTFSLMGEVKTHICISDPPQRLQTGDILYIDCYQMWQGPCGPDFPSQPSPNPTVIEAGSVYPVVLDAPVQHNNPNNPMPITFSISKLGSDNYTMIGQFQDGSWSRMSFDVRFPQEPGSYILQATYSPPDYQFYTCSDVIIRGNTGSNGTVGDCMNCQHGGWIDWLEYFGLK